MSDLTPLLLRSCPNVRPDPAVADGAQNYKAVAWDDIAKALKLDDVK